MVTGARGTSSASIQFVVKVKKSLGGCGQTAETMYSVHYHCWGCRVGCFVSQLGNDDHAVSCSPLIGQLPSSIYRADNGASNESVTREAWAS